MLGLNEAIKHCHDKATELEQEAQQWLECNPIGEPRARVDKAYEDCRECAAEHRQLAEWLTELKAYREAFGSIDIPGISFGKRLAEALTKIEEIQNNERE